MCKISILFCIILMVTACSNNNIQNKSAVLGCKRVNANQDATLTAKEHYDAMIFCLRKNKQEEALNHFTLGGIDTWYQAVVRPGPVSQVKHRSLLKNSLDKLNEKDRQAAWKIFNTALHDKNQLASVCQHTALVGEIRSKNQIFDNIAWEKAMQGYLHCQNF